MFNSVQTPNESIFNGARTGPGSYSGSVGNNTDESWSVPATSNHPGGVNVTMADGHVQFIKNSISKPDLVGTFYKGERRSDQLRCLLM